MSLLSQNTVTFSGYTPKLIVSSPLLLYNQIQTHTLIYVLHLTAVIKLCQPCKPTCRITKNTYVFMSISLSPSNLRLREEYLHNISVLSSLCLSRDSQELIKFTSVLAQITAMSLLFNVSETRSLRLSSAMAEHKLNSNTICSIRVHNNNVARRRSTNGI